jgi:hypothetical protein
VPIIFGTFNRSTSTTDEVELSQTLQTAFGKFVKDPGYDFAANWPKYNANASVPTLAKIAYHGNVQPDNFAEPVDPSDTVSVGNVLVNCGVFIGAPFTNRICHVQNGTSSLTSVPEARDILHYTQVLLTRTMGSQKMDHDILQNW